MFTRLKEILLVGCVPLIISAQDDFYPTETFYGGGVGFSQMFLFVDVGKLEAFELLGTIVDTSAPGGTRGLGLNTSDFTYPFVINGGEGFSQITGRWRLGGYAGVGSSFISGKPDITLFLDLDQDGEFDQGTETEVAYQGNYAPDIQAKFSILISGATVEYALPIFRGLEISAGTLMGLGRVNLSLTQSSGSPGWKDQFANIFDIGADGYYAVTNVNGDTSINQADIDFVQEREFPSTPTGGAMTSLTGTFFDMQPYAAIKLQFLDRVGLRLSVGFNIGAVSQGRWILNDRNPISDSQATNFNGLALRAMIYFGL